MAVKPQQTHKTASKITATAVESIDREGNETGGKTQGKEDRSPKTREKGTANIHGQKKQDRKRHQNPRTRTRARPTTRTMTRTRTRNTDKNKNQANERARSTDNDTAKEDNT